MGDDWPQPTPSYGQSDYPPSDYQYPHPGHPYPYPPTVYVMQPQRQRPNWLLVLLASIGGIVIVCCIAPLVLSALGALAGIGGASTSSQGTSSSTPQPTAGVGAMITINDVSCTLLSVHSIGSDDIVKPKAGNHFIVVHITLTNNSNSEIHYNPLDFHVLSGSGNITDPEFVAPSTYTANNELDAGALAPSGTVTADLIFQVATGDHQAKLTWQPNFFGSDTDYVWVLGL